MTPTDWTWQKRSLNSLSPEEQLSAELIERVGIGQHYLTRPETAAALNQGYVRVWPPMRREALELVREEARQILESHRPPALPDGAPEKIREVLAEADQKLAAV